ncbi:hypothetical protein FH972_000889 [Carpinus fangiana]|uniref:Uncharacterized protein n=1 Tax=Carpinus fangiana TaxID=176857 RepID=A0A5N6QCF0_9ROSI|nr:hypothetical protein FH972_000889 [Carpinus fangiana]
MEGRETFSTRETIHDPFKPWKYILFPTIRAGYAFSVFSMAIGIDLGVVEEVDAMISTALQQRLGLLHVQLVPEAFPVTKISMSTLSLTLISSRVMKRQIYPIFCSASEAPLRRGASASITLSFGGSLMSPVGSFGSRRSLWAHLARGVVGNDPCALFLVRLVERRIEFLKTLPRLLRGNCENSPSPRFPVEFAEEDEDQPRDPYGYRIVV